VRSTFLKTCNVWFGADVVGLLVRNSGNSVLESARCLIFVLSCDSKVSWWCFKRRLRCDRLAFIDSTTGFTLTQAHCIVNQPQFKPHFMQFKGVGSLYLTDSFRRLLAWLVNHGVAIPWLLASLGRDDTYIGDCV